MLLRTVKVMSNKERLNCYRPEETTESWQLKASESRQLKASGPWVLDWLLEQEKDINGKTDGTQKKCLEF